MSGIFRNYFISLSSFPAFAAIVAAVVSNPAVAEWVRVGENARSVAYVDTHILRSGSTATYWVMFDYKAIQESPRSGRKYLSEKSQREIDCKAERDRVLFFTWHSDQMGWGTVVYTGRRDTSWEPTSGPGSYAQAFWQFVCDRIGDSSESR